MNRPTSLLNVVVEEILRQHSVPSKRDVDLINRRHSEEGDAFLGITLPAFGSAIELGLEQGFITRAMFPGFKSRGLGGPLPAFLQGLVMKIFGIDGVLLDCVDADAVYGIRQICYLLKKPKAECTDKRNKLARAQYVNTEADLVTFTEKARESNPLLSKLSLLLWGGSIFSDVSAEELLPRHGPGVTSDRKLQNERWEISTWSERQNDVFPLDVYALPNFGWYDHLANVDLLSPERESPVKVILVPKTVKTPRVIAVEASHVMYVQQGLMRYLVERLERYPLTRESVRFTDQQPNKDHAAACSLDKSLATLDLSEASDRVHVDLVRNIFGRSPVLPFLINSRTERASLDGGKTSLPLAKFASMGSATCFPVLAMTCYTLIQYALHEHHSITPSRSSIRRFSAMVDVYGDDLIVPTYAREDIQRVLESFGLKVNSKKSFSRGYFRESCGGDYYRGYEVTPVYLRHAIPSLNGQTDPTVLESLASTSDQLYKKGLWRSCQVLRDWVEKLSRSRIPRSPFQGDGIKFYSCFLTTRARYSYELNAYVQRRRVLVPKKVEDPCSDIGSVLKSLSSAIGRGGLESTSTRFDDSSVLDFSKSVKRGTFNTKFRWVGASIGSHAG